MHIIVRVVVKELGVFVVGLRDTCVDVQQRVGNKSQDIDCDP